MNHRPSFKVTREDFESDASIRNAVTNTKQIGDRCSMNKTLRYLLLKVKERARTFPVTCNFVQLYIYIYVCKSRVRRIRRFTYIYPIFVPSWQAATYSRIAHTRLMWMSDINVNFRNCFLLLDYLFTSYLISSSLKKLIIVLIFIKIHQIHQKTLKMKDGRILNKIIKFIV